MTTFRGNIPIAQIPDLRGEVAINHPRIPPKRIPEIPVVPKDDTALADAIKKLNECQAALAELKKPIAAGKDGRDGIDGKPGRDGKDADTVALQKQIMDGLAQIKVIHGKDGGDGKPGKDADTSALLLEIDALRKELAVFRGQKLTAELYNIDGTLSQRVTFSATEPLKLRLVPVGGK